MTTPLEKDPGPRRSRWRTPVPGWLALLPILVAVAIILYFGTELSFGLASSLALASELIRPQVFEELTQVITLYFPVLLIIPPLVAIAASFRRARQGTLLWILAIAVRNGLSLPDELRSLARTARRRQKLKLAALAGLLEAGTPLPDALNRISGLVPRDALVAIRLGQEAGTLPGSLRDAALAHARQQRERVMGNSPHAGVWTYVWLVFSLLVAFAGFQMYRIVPKYKRIFEDFQIGLPVTTQLLIEFWQWGFRHAWLIVLILVLFVFFGIRVVRSDADSPRCQWLAQWRRRRRTPLILRNVVQLVSLGRPIGQGLEGMSLHHETTAWGSAIKQTAVEIGRGRSTWDSLHSVGLIDQGEWALLTTAERAGNLVWALQMISDRIERRRFDRMFALNQLTHPLAILLLGIVVAVYVLALFMPLVKVLQSLA